MARGSLGEVSLNLARGLTMGAADAVPGVSGGTVALVVGIYPRLVDSIRSGSMVLSRGLTLDLRGAMAAWRSIEWRLIVPLLSGIAIAIVVLAGLLESLLLDHPIQMAGLILGLVLGSTVLALRLLSRRGTREWMLIGASGLGFFVLLGLAPDGSAGDSTSHPLWAFFVAGAVAVCAMILPGVSGAFLLVAVGMYAAVLSAVNTRDFLVLGVFLAGCIVGLALFSRLLHWALNHHYQVVLSLMIGLMVGSLRVLWPWPEGVESVGLESPGESVLAATSLFAAGVLIVLALDLVARRIHNRSIRDEVDDLQAI